MGSDLTQLTGLFQSYICIVIAYLLGSIPTSYLLGKVFYQQDIRESGSGNIGATNALRTFGMKAGGIVLLIDVLKGIAAISLTRLIMGGITGSANVEFMVSVCGLVVIIGHIFNVFLGFKGGKGVATASGVFLLLQPLSFLYCIVLFAFVVKVSKYVSLGSILAAFAFMMIEIFTQLIMNFPNKPRLYMIIVIALLIIIRHSANIKRLINGVENKFEPAKHNY